jgi:hypothetical protein
MVLYIPQNAFTQTIVNAYAKVTSISGTTISLSNVDETYDTFDAGDDIFIMQMQDDVIGSNTGNNASFGDLDDIENAGRYDGLKITAVTRSGGVLTSITVSSSTWLGYYNISANTSVQIITLPKLGGGADYTTTSDLTCLAWNGDVGGVITFQVNGDLNLQHDINVDGKGFRGGAADVGGSGGCDANTYRIATSGNYYADKGEGIYKNTNVDYVSGRGHILTGGGGGNSHNAGGAGGGNASVGGAGGFGWRCNPSAGGIGGLDLSTYNSAWIVFMGGGGGSGEGNNALATSGGNGGGVILIQADSIITSSSCSGVKISANGNSVADNGGNDGAGGGGAGGSIIFHVTGFDIDVNCSLSIEANGGKGGDVNSGAEHGGGGGGAMGAVIFSNDAPTTNTTIVTDPGAGGNSGGSNNHPGTPADGTVGAGDGIIENDGSGPLPVELLSFIANIQSDVTLLEWSTASEVNNMGFDIEKSNNGEIWNRIDFVHGNGNSNVLINYRFVDKDPYNGITYYRLKQIDFDGKMAYSKVVSVSIKKKKHLVYRFAPNPASQVLYIKTNIKEDYQLNIYTVEGRLIRKIVLNPETKSIPVDNLPEGMYLFEIRLGDSVIKQKVLIKR